MIYFNKLLLVSWSQCLHCFLLSHSNLLEINSKIPRNEFIEPTIKKTAKKAVFFVFSNKTQHRTKYKSDRMWTLSQRLCNYSSKIVPNCVFVNIFLLSLFSNGHKKSGTPLLQFRFWGSRIARQSETCNTKPTPYVEV